MRGDFGIGAGSKSDWRKKIAKFAESYQEPYKTTHKPLNNGIDGQLHLGDALSSTSDTIDVFLLVTTLLEPSV